MHVLLDLILYFLSIQSLQINNINTNLIADHQLHEVGLSLKWLHLFKLFFDDCLDFCF